QEQQGCRIGGQAGGANTYALWPNKDLGGGVSLCRRSRPLRGRPKAADTGRSASPLADASSRYTPALHTPGRGSVQLLADVAGARAGTGRGPARAKPP